MLRFVLIERYVVARAGLQCCGPAGISMHKQHVNLSYTTKNDWQQHTLSNRFSLILSPECHLSLAVAYS